MTDSAQQECHGGPLDGELVSDRGLFFATMATVEVVRDGVVLHPGFQSGLYERRRGQAGHWWRARESAASRS